MSEKDFLNSYMNSKIVFPHCIRIVMWPEPGALTQWVNSIKELKFQLKNVHQRLIQTMSDQNPQVNVVVDGHKSTIEINPPKSLLDESGAIQ